MLCASNSNHHHLSTFLNFVEKTFNASEQKEILLQKNSDGLTAFDYAILSKNPINFDSFLNLYVKVTKDFEAKKLITTYFSNNGEHFDAIKQKSQDEKVLFWNFCNFIEGLHEEKPLDEILFNLRDLRKSA